MRSKKSEKFTLVFKAIAPFQFLFFCSPSCLQHHSVLWRKKTSTDCILKVDFLNWYSVAVTVSNANEWTESISTAIKVSKKYYACISRHVSRLFSLNILNYRFITVYGKTYRLLKYLMHSKRNGESFQRWQHDRYIAGWAKLIINCWILIDSFLSRDINNTNWCERLRMFGATI